MARYVKLILLLVGVIWLGTAFAQGGYEKVYPLDVSPQPDILQDRKFFKEGMTGTKKPALEIEEEELLPAEEELGPPIHIGTEPSEIYYKLSVNDRIYISVWRVPVLSLEFVVGPDGRISYPLIGDIRTAGRTLSELDAEITEKLKVYVVDPHVSVMIRAFAGDKVTVIGEVRSPGIYKFVGKTKIIDVVALAGGFTDRARSSSLVIVREPQDPSEDESLILAHIKNILKGDIKSNIDVQPNDIIYVSRTTISHVKEFYDNWIVPTMSRILDYESYKSIRRSRHSR